MDRPHLLTTISCEISIHLIDYTADRPSTLRETANRTKVKMVNPKMRQMIVKASPVPPLSYDLIFLRQADADDV